MFYVVGCLDTLLGIRQKCPGISGEMIEEHFRPATEAEKPKFKTGDWIRQKSYPHATNMVAHFNGRAYILRTGVMLEMKKQDEWEIAYEKQRKDRVMETQRIYISGAISGHDLVERYEAFEDIEKLLKFKGFEVFNPMKNGLPKDATTAQHMRRDLNELTREDEPYTAIYMMKGWNHSAGCWTEFKAALAIGLEVIFEQIDKPVKFE